MKRKEMSLSTEQLSSRELIENDWIGVHQYVACQYQPRDLIQKKSRKGLFIKQ